MDPLPINDWFGLYQHLATAERPYRALSDTSFDLLSSLRDTVADATIPLATAPTPQVLFETTSQFGRIIVEQQGAKRVLRLGEQRVVQTVITPGKPDVIESEYIELAMVALLLTPEVKRVLLVGLGGGAIPMFLRWADPALVIDVVEIDPEVVRIAKEWFGFCEDTKLCAHVADGLEFVEQAGPRYDVILLDAYAPDFIPPHLVTRRFLFALIKRLSARGVVISDVWGPPSAHYESIVATQQAAFAELHILHCVRDKNKVLIGIPSGEPTGG